MVKPVGGSSQPPTVTGTDTQQTRGVPSKTDSEGQGAPAKSVDPEASKKAREAVSKDPAAMFRQAQLQGSITDVKALVQNAQKSKDGALGISKDEYDAIKKTHKNQPFDSESMKWLEKNNRPLHAALVSDLDYSGYVGTTNGSLNPTRAGGELKADAARREERLDKLPKESEFGPNGLPKNVPEGQQLGHDTHTNNDVTAYKTGPNTTKVVGDELANISKDQITNARQEQKDFCVKMSALTGSAIGNPPTVKGAKAYFQAMADGGASPEKIQSEYQQYLKTFYRHPGGVDWNPKLDPKNLDPSFSQQPLAKDGKRLIDCEAFSALTENVLGGIKKNGQPMFDIKHASSDVHVTCGVFPHGGDPRKGFVVDNSEVHKFDFNPLLEKDFKSGSWDKQTEFLLRNHMDVKKEGTATKYGTSYNNMEPPSSKVPIKK